jgi:hypothetical protein
MKREYLLVSLAILAIGSLVWYLNRKAQKKVSLEIGEVSIVSRKAS